MKVTIMIKTKSNQQSSNAHGELCSVIRWSTQEEVTVFFTTASFTIIGRYMLQWQNFGNKQFWNRQLAQNPELLPVHVVVFLKIKSMGLKLDLL